MTISAVVIAKNEEKNIERCLKSILWCNEVIVVDDHSTDATVSIAKKLGATMYTHSLDNDFSQSRNFALEKAKGEWVLFIDADEVISNDLKNEILRVTQNDNGIQGYYIKRRDYMWGKALFHGDAGNVRLLRLAKQGKGKWVGKVHEIWNVKGPTLVLSHPLLHYPHPTLKEFLQEINFYSTLRAQELHEKGVKAQWGDILLHMKGKFIQDYFFKMGFLDGMVGFVVAILMSFHSFLVRGKLWQLSKR